MLRETHPDRLANAISYFLTQTADCTAGKLMHLLYMLDFEHYKATGRSVTGQAYCALETGPVPADVYFALSAPAGTPTVLDSILDMGAWQEKGILAAKQPFVDEDLTPRQMTLLAGLAAMFHEGAETLRNTVCASASPWYKCYRQGAGTQSCIPYELILDGLPQRDSILESAHEHAMRAAARVASASC
jgi:uncharacterized phage-associated protein